MKKTFITPDIRIVRLDANEILMGIDQPSMNIERYEFDEEGKVGTPVRQSIFD